MLQAFALHGLKLQMYSLETVEKLPQKMNFAFTPAEILGSWIQQKYDEGVELKDKTISKHVMTMLTAKIISDVNILSVKEFTTQQLLLFFGASMDGLNRIHTALLANTDNPCFKIETDAITV
jgi:hypothetical protein